MPLPEATHKKAKNKLKSSLIAFLITVPLLAGVFSYAAPRVLAGDIDNCTCTIDSGMTEEKAAEVIGPNWTKCAAYRESLKVRATGENMAGEVQDRVTDCNGNDWGEIGSGVNAEEKKRAEMISRYDARLQMAAMGITAGPCAPTIPAPSDSSDIDACKAWLAGGSQEAAAAVAFVTPTQRAAFDAAAATNKNVTEKVGIAGGLVSQVVSAVGRGIERVVVSIIAMIFFALATLLLYLNRLIIVALDWFMNLPYEMLAMTTGNSVLDVWKMMRTFVNSIFIIVLAIIALANILGVGGDRYKIKSALPKIILALLLVNFSYKICVVVLDIANVLTQSVLNLSTVGAAASAAGASKKSIADVLFETMLSPGTLFRLIKGEGDVGIVDVLIAGYTSINLLMFSLIPLVAIAMVFFVRIVVLMILIAVSPLVALAYAVPGMEGTTKKFQEKFIFWAIMPVKTMFVLTLGMLLIKNITNVEGLDTKITDINKSVAGNSGQGSAVLATTEYAMVFINAWMGIVIFWLGAWETIKNEHTAGAVNAIRSAGTKAIKAAKNYVPRPYGLDMKKLKDWGTARAQKLGVDKKIKDATAAINDKETEKRNLEVEARGVGVDPVRKAELDGRIAEIDSDIDKKKDERTKFVEERGSEEYKKAVRNSSITKLAGSVSINPIPVKYDALIAGIKEGKKTGGVWGAIKAAPGALGAGAKDNFSRQGRREMWDRFKAGRLTHTKAGDKAAIKMIVGNVKENLAQKFELESLSRAEGLSTAATAGGERGTFKHWLGLQANMPNEIRVKIEQKYQKEINEGVENDKKSMNGSELMQRFEKFKDDPSLQGMLNRRAYLNAVLDKADELNTSQINSLREYFAQTISEYQNPRMPTDQKILGDSDPLVYVKKAAEKNSRIFSEDLYRQAQGINPVTAAQIRAAAVTSAKTDTEAKLKKQELEVKIKDLLDLANKISGGKGSFKDVQDWYNNYMSMEESTTFFTPEQEETFRQAHNIMRDDQAVKVQELIGAKKDNLLGKAEEAREAGHDDEAKRLEEEYRQAENMAVAGPWGERGPGSQMFKHAANNSTYKMTMTFGDSSLDDLGDSSTDKLTDILNPSKLEVKDFKNRGRDNIRQIWALLSPERRKQLLDSKTRSDNGFGGDVAGHIDAVNKEYEGVLFELKREMEKYVKKGNDDLEKYATILKSAGNGAKDYKGDANYEYLKERGLVKFNNDGTFNKFNNKRIDLGLRQWFLEERAGTGKGSFVHGKMKDGERKTAMDGDDFKKAFGEGTTIGIDAEKEIKKFVDGKLKEYMSKSEKYSDKYFNKLKAEGIVGFKEDGSFDKISKEDAENLLRKMFLSEKEEKAYENK